MNYITKNFINEDMSCTLCKIKLIKSWYSHINSKKHMKNLMKYAKENNMCIRYIDA